MTNMSRREAVMTGLGLALGSTLLGDEAPADARHVPSSEAGASPSPRATAHRRWPVVFLPHGGGPWPFVPLGFVDAHEAQSLSAYLSSLRTLAPERPRALLVISAHWEEPVPTLMTAAHPPMLYDYYGFPPASYTIQWPAPGAPTLATRVEGLLRGAGFDVAHDARRGYDHGTFVPMKVAFPNADIPTLQLSLKAGLRPDEHLAMGRALAPLRDEGVLIVGSGMSYHDLRGFFGGTGHQVAEVFDAWLQSAATAAPAERDARLSRWHEAPMARRAHPREEHLLPLMVIAGAAGNDHGRTTYSDTFAGVRISAFQYG